MTTFVRRVPPAFDEGYWHTAAGYMERELGSVSDTEHARHEHPAGFVDASGSAPGHKKDMPYCFAPYDGLRGLGMQDIVEFDSIGAPELEQRRILEPAVLTPLPAPTQLSRKPFVPASSDSDDKGGRDNKASLIALAAVGLGVALLLSRR